MNERRVERVARALCWNADVDPDTLRPISKLPYWEFYIEWAEVAVKALENCLTPEYDSTRDQRREDAFVELD